MQEHIDDWSNIPDGPSRKKSRTRAMFLRFLFGGLGFVLLTAVAAAAIVPQLAHMQKMYAAPLHGGHQQYDRHNQTKQSTTSGQVTLQLDPDAKTLNIEAKVSDAPPNTPLVMHVHGDGSCTGPILFMLQATSDDRGRASATMTFNQDANDDPLPTTLPDDWFFNVHDSTRQGSDGKPLSIACGAIKVDSSRLTGCAHLCPVQAQDQDQTTKSTTQSTAQGLTTLHLDTNAHTLAIQAIVFGAPPNTPLVMHVHGEGSCTGPIYFMLEATSDDTGHTFATKTFDHQDDTTIPSNWFFNVHDTTRQGPDGKPLSIACGAIQTIDPTTAFAKLNPVQQSSATPTPTPNVDVAKQQSTTPTQSSTKGFTTLSLDPNTHILTIQAIVFGAPSNRPLVMHVHGGGSCTGPILFMLQATSDNAGNAYATTTFSQDANNNALPNTIPSDWFFNVHDTTRQGPDGKPLSIACGPVKVADSSGLRARALMLPVQPDQTTAPAKPASAPQGTTQGLTVLYLNAAAHTLNVLVHVIGAPPNTPLAMTIHGDGSCTGPTLFMLQTVSDNTGNATAIMPFDDPHDTTIPGNWFFAAHDITKQGSDKQPLPIACGPIQTPGQVGLAQLSPA